MTTAIAKRQNGQSATPLGTLVDQFFQNSFRRIFDDNYWDGGTLLSSRSVPVNIREADQHYEMDVIAPGLKRENFSINIQDKLLTISCECREEREDKNTHQGWVRNEYVQRSFSRTFTLDDTVDTNGITATYTDGILRLNIPKSEKVKKLSRTIEIQ